MELKRILGAAIGTSALATTLVAATSTPAQAVVWNCRTGFSSVGAWGTCSSGNSKFRVNVLCQNLITRAAYAKAGNWVRLGQVSTIQGCGNVFEAYYGKPWISTP